MKVDEIKLLYQYNEWVNGRILAGCAKVSAEQYAAPNDCGTGWSGLRATMVHMLDSIWQTRITLQGFYAQPLANDAAYDATELHDDAFPTCAMLQTRWATEERELQAYIDGLNEETLNGMLHYVIPGKERHYVVWQFLLDDLLHIAQHRSEAAVLLTQYGQSPGNLEFSMFLNERA